MFFYTALFITCVFIALIILYLYHSLADIGKVIYRALLPSSKNKFTPRHTEKDLAATINDTPTPWGWNANAAPERTKRPPVVLSARRTPWGWPGNDHEAREHGQVKQSKSADRSASHLSYSSSSDLDTSEKPEVGWPYREEQFEFAGKAFKVTHKAAPARANLSETGKPWGW